MPSIVAWDQLCKRARARRIRDLLQRPSFRPSEDHTANLRQFVDAHGEDGFHLAWEPRGVWLGAPDLVAELSEELDLIAVVDRFREAPAAGHDILYTRLHGRSEDRFDYEYDCWEEELDERAAKLRNAAQTHRRGYSLFNDFEMCENTESLARQCET